MLQPECAVGIMVPGLNFWQTAHIVPPARLSIGKMRFQAISLATG